MLGEEEVEENALYSWDFWIWNLMGVQGKLAYLGSLYLIERTEFPVLSSGYAFQTLKPESNFPTKTLEYSR